MFAWYRSNSTEAQTVPHSAWHLNAEAISVDEHCHHRLWLILPVFRLAWCICPVHSVVTVPLSRLNKKGARNESPRSRREALRQAPTKALQNYVGQTRDNGHRRASSEVWILSAPGLFILYKISLCWISLGTCFCAKMMVFLLPGGEKRKHRFTKLLVIYS